MTQHRIPARRQMQMVAAFYPKRDAISERTKHHVGPRPQCYDDFARDRCTIWSGKPPCPAVLLKGCCVADQKASTLALEQRGVGLAQSARIGNETGRWQINRASKLSVQVGLALGDRFGIENLARNTIMPGTLQFGRSGGERSLGAEQLHRSEERRVGKECRSRRARVEERKERR